MPTRERRTRRKRLPAAEGRQALLEAGRDYVYEHPLGEPLDHVRVTDVAERVGLSIGAVYHHWDSQDDYRDDLIDLLLSPEEYPAAHRTAAAIAETMTGSPALEELVRVAATISYADLAAPPDRERLTLVLAAYGDAEIDARLATQSAEVGARWAELFATYFPAYGLEPRPPFGYDTIAVVLMALVQGMNVRRNVDPDSVTGELAPGWDLFASASLAFLVSACRPVAPDDDPADGRRDLWDLARRLIPRRTPAV